MSTSPINLLRGAEIFPVAHVPLSVVRVGGGSFDRHGHDFHELVMVAQGTAHHTLFPPDSDECHHINLKTGDLFLVPIGWSHCYKQSDQYEIYNILFAPEFVERWQGDDAEFGFLEREGELPPAWKLQRGEHEHLETMLQVITRELTGRQQGFSVAAQAKLAEVLVWVGRLKTGLAERRAPESQIAASLAIEFMERNFAEEISLDDIARIAHLSSHYFCEVFKNATGLSPGRYLLRLRLEHSRYLLLTTSRPVTQVARDAGFADASYFARAFKTAFGTAPTRLRSTGR